MTSRLICPACASPDGREIYEVKGFAIRKCSSCKTLYVRDIPDRSVLDQIYTDGDYYDLDDQLAHRVRTEHRRRLEILQKFAKSGRVLDVGCANGLFLDHAKSAGYETFGIEISPKNASIASGKGHGIFVGSFAEYSLIKPQERFPLITCLDVIEHVESPSNFMQLLSQYLFPGGILVVSTPNYSGVVARILGKRDVFLTPPEHLNFFTSAGLHTLANEAGLSPVYKTTFGRLTRNELDRAIARYFPRIIQPISPLLRAGIQTGFHALNAVQAGLEIEMYFKKAEP